MTNSELVDEYTRVKSELIEVRSQADALAKSCSVLSKRAYLTTTEVDDIRAALDKYLEAAK
jgi:hypothetical protein